MVGVVAGIGAVNRRLAGSRIKISRPTACTALQGPFARRDKEGVVHQIAMQIGALSTATDGADRHTLQIAGRPVLIPWNISSRVGFTHRFSCFQSISCACSDRAVTGSLSSSRGGEPLWGHCARPTRATWPAGQGPPATKRHCQRAGPPPPPAPATTATPVYRVPKGRL